MPNVLNSSGLTTATLAEIIANLTTNYQQIYGSDINLASNTPDGQMMNIFAQAVIDIQDLMVQIYNTFDPDQAVGTTLDQRCALNGVVRQGGTYTTTDVALTTDNTAFNLNGLDNAFPTLPLYTAQDSAGNSYNLITSLSCTIGTSLYTVPFQAANTGAILATPNTINVPVTVSIHVTNINNPSNYLTLGQAEESDAALKIRRQLSVSLSSQGFLASLLAALENINGVTSAFVHENTTDTTDAFSVPAHSIWVIVAGSAAASSIAEAIYQKRNAGCGMYAAPGGYSYTVTQIDGSGFIVYWSGVVAEPLYIEFDVHSISGATISGAEVTALKSYLVANLIPAAYQTININEIGTLVQAYNSDFLATLVGLSSDGITYVNYITPSALNYQFTLSTAHIAVTVV